MSSADGQASSSNKNDFVVVWYTDPVSVMNASTQTAIAELNHIVDTVMIFDTSDTCADYVYSITDRQILLVVHESNGAQLVRKVLHVTCLRLVYILCIDQSTHPPWAEACKSIRCIFVDHMSICERIKMDTRDDSIAWNIIDTSSVNSTTLKNTNKQEAQFMYSQILKYILTETSYSEDHLDKLIEFLQKDRPRDVERIAEFRKNVLERPIWCYTNYVFVYKTLNAALRTSDVEVLWMMGIFIKALHQQIKQLHTYIKEVKTLRLYRGVIMPTSAFQKIPEKQGGLLSINDFLSTSRCKDVSLSFIAHGAPNCTPVLFEIDIDQSISTDVFYADIQSISQYSYEEEYLFTMGSVFRIESVAEPNENGVRYVYLTLTTGHDPELTQLTHYIRSQLPKPSLRSICLLLMKMGNHEEVIKLSKTAIKTSSEGFDLFIHHFFLGVCYSITGQHEYALASCESLSQYFSQLPHDLQNIPLFQHIKTFTLFQEDKLGSLSTALQSVLQHADEYPDEFPNEPFRAEMLIGSEYMISMDLQKKGHLQDALSHGKKAYELAKERLPSKHPTIAGLLDNLADIYKSLDKDAEMLFCIEESMKIKQDSLPFDHIAITATHQRYRRVQNSIDHSVSESYKRSLTATLLEYQSNPKQSPKKLLELAEISVKEHQIDGALFMIDQYFRIEKENDVPSDDSDLATAYVIKGRCYYEKKDYPKALQNMEQADELAKKHLKPTDQRRITILYTMVNIYIEQNNVEKAFVNIDQIEVLMKEGSDDDFKRQGADVLKITYLIFMQRGVDLMRVDEHDKALFELQNCFKVQMKVLPSDHRDLAKTYDLIGTCFREQKKYVDALKYYQNAQNIWEKCLPPNDLHLAENWTILGLIHRSLKHHDDAACVFIKCLNIQLSVLAAEHIDLAETYNRIGDTYSLAKNFEAALPYFKKCLNIQMKHLPLTDPDILHCRKSIAFACQSTNQYDEALFQYEEILKTQQNTLPCNHIDIAETHSTIAEVYRSVKQFEEALSHARRCFDIQKSSLSPNDIELAKTHSDIGRICVQLGNFTDAQTHIQYALNIRRIHLPTSMPELMESYQVLNYIYMQLHQFESSLLSNFQCLELQRSVLPSQHLDIASTLKAIANTYNLTGSYREALLNQEQCLDIQINLLSSDDPLLADTYSSIADSYHKLKQEPQALTYFQKAVDIQLKHLPTISSTFIENLKNLGLVHFILKQYENSLSAYYQCLEIQLIVLPHQNLDIAKTYRKIGLVHDTVKQHSEACLNFRKCFDIQQKLLPPDDIEIGITHSNIGAACKELEKLPDALNHYQCALNIQLIHLPTTTLNVIKSWEMLGCIYTMLGQYEDALFARFECLEMQLNVLPFHHLDVAITYTAISASYYLLENYSDAFVNWKQCLDIQMALLSPDSIELVQTHSQIASTLVKLGKTSEALAHYQCAIDIQWKHLPGTSSELIKNMRSVGKIHSDSNRFKDSLLVYNECLELQLTLLPSQQTEIAITHRMIGFVHCKVRQYEKARLCFEKCLAIQRTVLPPNHTDLIQSQSLINSLPASRH